MLLKEKELQLRGGGVIAAPWYDSCHARDSWPMFGCRDGCFKGDNALDVHRFFQGTLSTHPSGLAAQP